MMYDDDDEDKNLSQKTRQDTNHVNHTNEKLIGIDRMSDFVNLFLFKEKSANQCFLGFLAV